ncbi:hypothetical protein [Mesorhizobium loti]|uniref:Uncharacterized protein n=1 Tax=Mesorhizobium loti R88b TaxID=935548 RepID=A0A6M7WQC7_RHILI|nr:hypothetical protein [Mesorhizobium loti]QKD04267.1 hypothetical protein EB235_24600 [Mesorhizobium loti R88b]
MATARAEAKHNPAQDLEAISHKRLAFTERGKDILAARLELEHQGIRPEERSNWGPDPRDLAASMLDGSALPAARSPTPGEELFQLLVEQQAVTIALDELAERENQARRIAAAEALRETADEWRRLVRRRAMAVIELRQANQEAATFRERLRRIGGNNPNLIADATSGPLFGPPVVGDGAYTFLESCVSAGIISKKEITNAA